VFELTLSYLNEISILDLIFGSISIVDILIYFLILFFLLASFEARRGRVYVSILYILFMALLYAKPYFNPFTVVSIYDVGQGDSILISLPNGKCNILIDCYNNILDHLKKDGIKDIDVVIITHGHADHMDDYEDVIDFYGRVKTYSSKYDETILLNELKGKYDIELLKSGDKLMLEEITFEVLGPMRKYDNENDNSLVLQTVINGYAYLFTGDIEKEAEIDLVNKYRDKLYSNFIKVAHHGSSTSTTKEFLNYVKPNYYLLSVKKDNKYGFPNNSLILNSKNLYRTDEIGTFKIYSRKNTFYIRKKLLLW
jgi:competence protein ComEC